MTEIGISRITLSGWNPRRNFEPEAFEELKKSIQEHGILEPLIVRMNPKNPEAGYELVAGERRFRAAQELGLELVPVVVMQLSDREVREIMLIENLQRSGLEPLEEAEALQVLLQDGTTQEDMGKMLGKSQSWIANRLRLLKAPDELKELIISREITPKHALTLLPVANYPPLLGDVLTGLKERDNSGEPVTVSELDEIIEEAVGNAEYAFNIDSFDWDKRKYSDFFDRSGCDGCKDFVIIKSFNDEEERHCLKVECWSHKLTEAQKKYDKAKAAEHKKLENKKVVDTANMEYGTYKRHHPVDDWDKTACNTCDKCKKDKHNDLVCLDPACYDKKDRAHRREVQKQLREEDKKAWEYLDSKIANIESIDGKKARWILNYLADQQWSGAVRVGLMPWDKTKHGEEVDVSKVPDEDVPKAIIRLIVARIFVERKADVKKMKSALEGLGM